MAPAKMLRETKTRTVITKSTINDQNIGSLKRGGKRKAESSPIQEKTKRSALGNLTNAVINAKENGDKKIKLETANMVLRKTFQMPQPVAPKQTTYGSYATGRAAGLVPLKPSQPYGPYKQLEEVSAATRPTKVLTRAAARACQPVDTVIKKEALPLKLEVVKKPTRRISNEFEKSKTLDDTLYMSALDSW